jgi:hypothetical protein
MCPSRNPEFYGLSRNLVRDDHSLIPDPFLSIIFAILNAVYVN